MPKKETKATSAQTLADLEAVVQKMEEGELSLEEMLAEYAKGILLLKECQSRLTAAEKQMEDLSHELEEMQNA